MHFKNEHSRDLLAVLVLVLTCVSVGHVHGAVITTASSTAPTANVLISQAAGETYDQWRNTTSLRDIGQTFTYSDAFTLASITIQASSSTSIPADVLGTAFSLDIYTFGNAVDVTPDNLVSSQSGTLPASFSPGDYLTFDIPDLSLDANQQYGFVLRFTTSATNRILRVVTTHTTSAYPSGVDLYYNGSSYAGYAGDLVFFINTIPEPSTCLLLVSGAAGILFKDSRRRRSA